tara:strand:- start:112 stop:399 length:288 start_codon:yes stop_codon:yes gene_type:complete
MIDTDKYEGHSTEYTYEIVVVDDGKELIATYALLNDAPLLLAEVKRLRDIINKAMQQHGVLEMRGWLFESGCIDAEGQYESGHWERGYLNEGEEE